MAWVLVGNIRGPTGPTGPTGPAGGGITLVSGTGINISGSTTNPIVALSAGSIASLALADTAVQPAALAAYPLKAGPETISGDWVHSGSVDLAGPLLASGAEGEVGQVLAAQGTGLPAVWQHAGGGSIDMIFKFMTAVGGADPGLKSFNLNSAVYSSVTQIGFDSLDATGFDTDTILGLLATGNRIYLQQANDATRAVVFQVTGGATDNTGWWSVPVSFINTVGGGILFQNNANVTAVFILSSSTSGAPLTKTDDTNVTVTLGGSPTTALVTAASMALGWTGQLSVPRGGTGAATLTGYVKGTGTAALTASPTIPYSDISGAPSVVALADPSGLIGMSVVNGIAATALRSDGRHAIDPAIVPSWTGVHSFGATSIRDAITFPTGTSGYGIAWGISSGNSGNVWGAYSTGSMVMGSWVMPDITADAYQSSYGALSLGRSAVRLDGLNNLAGIYTAAPTTTARGTAVTLRAMWEATGNSAIRYGNATDSPTHTFLGTGLVDIGGAIRGTTATLIGGANNQIIKMQHASAYISWNDAGASTRYGFAQGTSAGIQLHADVGTLVLDGPAVSISGTTTVNGTLAVTSTINCHEIVSTSGPVRVIDVPGTAVYFAAQISGTEGLYFVANNSGIAASGMPANSYGVSVIAGSPFTVAIGGTARLTVSSTIATFTTPVYLEAQLNFNSGSAGYMEIVNRSAGALGLKIYHGAAGAAPVTTFDSAGGLILASGLTASGTVTFGGASRYTQFAATNGLATFRFDDNGMATTTFANGGIAGASQGIQLKWTYGTDGVTFYDAGRIAMHTNANYASGPNRATTMVFSVAVAAADTEIMRLASTGMVVTGTTTTTGSFRSTAAEGLRTVANSGYISWFNTAETTRSGYIQMVATDGVYIENEAGVHITMRSNGTDWLRMDANATHSSRLVRATGWYSSTGTLNGEAAEIGCSGGAAILVGYNRNSSVYLPVIVTGTSISVTPSGGGNFLFVSGVMAIRGTSTSQSTNVAYIGFQTSAAVEYGYIGDGGAGDGHITLSASNNLQIYANGFLAARVGNLASGSNREWQLNGTTNTSYFYYSSVESIYLRPGTGSGYIHMDTGAGINVGIPIVSTSTVSATSFTTTSARKTKRETGVPTGVRGMLKKLRPILYRMLTGDDSEQLGLIAEEVHEVCPALSDGKTVAYDRLAILLLSAWQDEHAE